MRSVVYMFLKTMFGVKMTKDITKFLDIVINTLDGFFNSETGDFKNILAVFMGIAASILIIFLFMDLMDKAAKEMFTLERLIIVFVRFFLVFIILLFLPNILSTSFTLAKGMYEVVDEATEDDELNNVTFFAESPKAKYGWKGVPSKKSQKTFTKKGPGKKKKNEWSFEQVLANKKKYVEETRGAKRRGAHGVTGDLEKPKDEANSACFVTKAGGIVRDFGAFLMAMLSGLVGYVAYAAAYFVALSTMLQLMIRTLFAPIAVVQCFDEGQRSAGFRYIKKFFATALTFAVIVGVLYASQIATNHLIVERLKDVAGVSVTKENINITVVGVRSLVNDLPFQAMLLVLKFAVVGMMLGASKIANDIMGVS